MPAELRPGDEEIRARVAGGDKEKIAPARGVSGLRRNHYFHRPLAFSNGFARPGGAAGRPRRGKAPEGLNALQGGDVAGAKRRSVRRFLLFCLFPLALTGCREVRVHTYAQGAVPGGGGDAVAVVRDRRQLEALGIRAPVRFDHEFGVALLLGPHRNAGFRQIIESIRANSDRVRIVAFETSPGEAAEPVPEYRTYTLWIVPNAVYRVGSIVDVVTPSGEKLAETVLR